MWFTGEVPWCAGQWVLNQRHTLSWLSWQICTAMQKAKWYSNICTMLRQAAQPQRFPKWGKDSPSSYLLPVQQLLGKFSCWRGRLWFPPLSRCCPSYQNKTTGHTKRGTDQSAPARCKMPLAPLFGGQGVGKAGIKKSPSASVLDTSFNKCHVWSKHRSRRMDDSCPI